MDSLFSHASVTAVVIANEEGFPLAYRSRNASSFGGDDAEVAAALISSLIGKTKYAMDRMNRGTVNFFTIDVSSGELLVALETDYVVIAIREKANK
ncbi:MAG: roadblock/LC7 domain-containing protein [Candidatus Heimdallarchaeota archaeon]|nr:roadblock/LC7 domain-containing protein [Candidatus Heimdallarchaeota archaeon]